MRFKLEGKNKSNKSLKINRMCFYLPFFSLTMIITVKNRFSRFLIGENSINFISNIILNLKIRFFFKFQSFVLNKYINLFIG